MSLAALDWSFRQEILSSSRKFVLVCLANHANDETGNAYPSIETVARETGLDRKTIIGAIDELVADNLIIDTGRRAGRTQRVKVYHFPILTVPKTEPLKGETVEKQSVNGPVNSPANGGETVEKQSQKRDSEPEPESGTGNRNMKGGTLPADGVEFQKWEKTLNGQFASALRTMRSDFRRQRKDKEITEAGCVLLNRKISVLNKLIDGPQPERRKPQVTERTKILQLTGRTDEKPKDTAVHVANVDWVAALRKAVDGGAA